MRSDKALREDTRIEVVQSLARAPGLLVLGVLVVAGLGITSVYFHWKAPEVVDRIRTARAAVSSDPAQRLDLWLEVGEPQIHNRLSLLRMSAQQPWLVTHVVEDGNPEGPSIIGLDLSTRSFEVGQIGITDVLVMRREVNDARLQYLDTVLATVLARVALDSVSGVLR